MFRRQKKIKSSWLRNDSTRKSKWTQKDLSEQIHIGFEEHFESKQKKQHVIDKDYRDFQKGMGLNTSHFDELENFSTTFNSELSCRKFSFSTNPEEMEFYFAQQYKIIWDGQDTREYECFRLWYDDVKFEEVKAFLMSKSQKNLTKCLVREMKLLSKHDPFVSENPLQAFMYKTDEYKKIFLYRKFISFKSAYMYDFNCDYCGINSHYSCPLTERFKFKRFFTSRRKNAWYQCTDICDCKDSKTTYYDYCEKCFLKLPHTLIVIEKRLLTAFILKEWEIPDDLLREICPSILS